MEGASSSNNHTQALKCPSDSKETLPETNSESSCTKNEQNIAGFEELETNISSNSSKMDSKAQNSHSGFSSESIRELDKFKILSGEAHNEFWVRGSARRFSPYPVHQQLFLQQQQEQERRRQSLLLASFSNGYQSTTSVCPSAYRHSMRARRARFMLGDKLSPVSKETVVAFADGFTVRLTSTQTDCLEKCVICMSYYSTNEELRKLKCNHKFHRKCIDEWFIKSSLCPVCRTHFAGGKTISRSNDVTVLLVTYYSMQNSNNPAFERRGSSIPPPGSETKDGLAACLSTIESSREVHNP